MYYIPRQVGLQYKGWDKTILYVTPLNADNLLAIAQEATPRTADLGERITLFRRAYVDILGIRGIALMRSRSHYVCVRLRDITARAANCRREP